VAVGVDDVRPVTHRRSGVDRTEHGALLGAGPAAEDVDLLTARDAQPDVAVRATQPLLRLCAVRGRFDEHEHERPGQIADPGHRRTGVGIGPVMHHLHACVTIVEGEARREVGDGQGDVRDAVVDRHAPMVGRSTRAPPVHSLLLMQSTVEPVESLEEDAAPDDSPAGVSSKVKLHVTVPAPEFERAIDAAFRKLAREVRIPGFRPGKAPRRLLEARLGSEVAREQALQDALPEYYVDAVNEHDVDVIAAPEIQITAGQDDGDVEFVAVVEIRPQVKLLGYDELRVEVPFQPVSDDDVDRQVDALRERFADLADSDFPLVDDAYATIDIAGTIDGEAVEGLTASDFLYRVGSAMVVDELDEQLRGTKPGAILEFTATLPDRFGELAGREARFRVIVKEAKQKVLPDLTDEWVQEASEFQTVDELRADIRKRVETMQRLKAQMALRDKVLEAAADLVPIEAPPTLVEAETRRRVEDLSHRLSHQGASLEQYLETTGQEPQAFVDEIRVGAARAVLADLALRAVVAQEAVTASDEEVDAEVQQLAERTEQKPAKVRRELERSGALEAVRSDVARGKALEFLVDHATVLDEGGNEIDLTVPEANLSDDTHDHDHDHHHDHDHDHDHDIEHKESEA
jgi:trigger factor